MGLGPPSSTPRVTLTVEGTPVDFLVDIGAEHSVLKQPLGKLKNTKTTVIGATGQKQYLWTTSRTVDLGRGQVTHSFLVIPERPIFIRKRLANEAEGTDRVYSNQAGGD